MSDRVTPCLYFDGAAETAAAFYTGLVPGSAITAVSRYGEGGFHPAGTAMVVEFTLAGRAFQAINGPAFERTEAMSLSVSADDQAEIDRLWDALTADGGRPGRCGWCTDRFGFSWQVVPRMLGERLAAGGPAAARTIAALCTMDKLDIAALEAAHRGDAPLAQAA